MLQPETILGLSLGTARVQAVLLRFQQSKATLLAIDEWQNTPGSRDPGEAAERLAGSLRSFIEYAGVKPDAASVALDSQNTFILTLPLEDGISRLERNDHIRWELGQYFPAEQPGDFITDVQPLTDNRIDRWVKSISVSVRKEDADALGSVIGRVGLSLRVIDVDHFSADTALRYNYPDIGRKNVALVGIKENRVDMSVLRNGVLESYSYQSVTSNQEIVDCIRSLPGVHRGLYSLSAYGEYLDSDLLTQIRKESDLLVEALNPLRHVGIGDSLRADEMLSHPSFRFAAAVGAALRRD